MSFDQGRKAALRARAIVALLSGASAIAVASAAWAADPTAATDATSGASPVGEVLVTAPRREVEARAVQMTAPNVERVQSAESIVKYPDFNAAEALGRIPDISLSSDTGEGRFVQIRGIDANLDGATFGGVPIGNTNAGGTAAGGGGRAVEFDTFPQGAIDGIIVTLTGLPDHEAEGLGGSIELSPRSAAHINTPFVDATLAGGYEPLHAHGGPFVGDLAVGARFGFGDKGFFLGDGADQPVRSGFISNPAPFSFVLNASVRDDRRAIDDLEESYVDQPGEPENEVNQYDLRRYDYHRTRFGIGGEFDFEPNDNHSYYVRGDDLGYRESVHKNFLLFANMGAGQALNGTVFTSTSMIPAITLTDEQETHRNQIYAIGGKDRFGDLIVDYHVAYEDATFHVDRNTGARFEGPTTAISYDNVSRKNLPIFTFPTGFNVNDPTQYSFLNTVNNGDTPLSNSTEVDADHEWSGAVNFAFPIHLLGADDQVRFGGEARFRGKEVNVFRETITAPLPGSLAGLSFPALTYYGGHYSNGPFINIDAIRNLIRSGAAASSGDIFQPGSFLSAQEDIYAGYAEYTAQWGKFGLLAGVRVEATDARYGAFVSTTDAAGDTTLSFLDRPVNYVNPFPTVQFRYNFTPKLVARATYSTGLARPGFEQNTAAASVDFTQSPIAISRGNPNLKPTLGQNFDFDIEAYLPEGGIIELGVFDKEFTNYIARRIEMNVTNDPLAAGQLATVTTFLNIPYAYARGIDAAWHQQFLFLPKPFDGFGIESNITLVASGDLEYTAAQDLTGKDEHGLLPGTSPATWNLAGFYEEDGVTARLSAEYVEHSIFGLGGDKALDSIQDNRLTLDFTAAYQINKRFQVYFDAKNLLNTPLRYYEGEPFRPIQREFYDSTYEAGVRMHFQ